LFWALALAKKRGWRLAASGDGLFDETGRRIAGDTERSIYEALEVPWQEPWERNVTFLSAERKMD